MQRLGGFVYFISSTSSIFRPLDHERQVLEPEVTLDLRVRGLGGPYAPDCDGVEEWTSSMPGECDVVFEVPQGVACCIGKGGGRFVRF